MNTAVSTRRKPAGGFRTLNAEELELIAGGNNTTTLDDVVVIGERDEDEGDDWWTDYDWNNDGYDPNDYSGGGGGGDGDTDQDEGLTAEAQEATKDVIEGLIAVLDENIKKYGDATIKLPNGMEIKASALLDALGKTLDILEAGQLTYDVVTGNGDVAAVAGFLAGLLGGAVAGAMGAGPIAVFAAAFAASYLTETMINQIVTNLDTAWDAAWQAEIQQNPGYTPGMHQLYMLMQLFGYQGPPPPVGGGSYYDEPDPNYGGMYNLP